MVRCTLKNFTKDKAQTKGKLKFFVSILTVHSVTNQNQIHYRKKQPNVSFEVFEVAGLFLRARINIV